MQEQLRCPRRYYPRGCDLSIFKEVSVLMCEKADLCLADACQLYWENAKTYRFSKGTPKALQTWVHPTLY